MQEEIIDRLKTVFHSGRRISFLVGAGISAESGIPTFRGKDGYWVSGSKNYKPQEIGTYRMFQVSCEEVWKWYLYRKAVTAFAEPNQSHIMLREMEELLQDQFVLISQNVDGLHRKVGNSAERTFLIHGDHDFVRCGDECSNELYPFPEGIDLKNRDTNYITSEEWGLLKCPKCGEELRPHVLWFDEYYDEKYYSLDTVLRRSKETGILFILGTSGATNLPQRITKTVLSRGGTVVDVNIHEGYFSELLKTKKNGFVVKSESSPFLTDLKNVLADL